MEETKKRPGNQHKLTCIQPPLQYPWLISLTGGKSGYICCTTSPLYKGHSKNFPHNLRINKVFNCCYGWLICSGRKNNFFLWNPVKFRLLQLPPLESEGTIRRAILSSPPCKTTGDFGPSCMIMLFYTRHDIAYCSLGEGEKHWNYVSYGTGVSCGFENPVVLNGSIFVENLGELVGIIHVTPTRIFMNRYGSLPLIPCSLEHSKALVESCGQLFYISIDWAGSFQEEISIVQAFKWDPDTFLWNKVRDVSDRVFFLDGTYSVSSYAAGGDFKGGFLYYIARRHNCLHSYCFADNTISTCFVHSLFNIPNTVTFPFLYLPDQRLIDGPPFEMSLVETRQYEVDKRKIKEEVGGVTIYDENDGVECRLICFPNDIIRYVTRFLNPIDYLNFRSVSRTCRLLAPQIKWREVTINLEDTPPLSPWLMSIDKDSNRYIFTDSKLGGKYFTNIPESLVGADIICSNNGWLLVSKSLHQISLCNPFTTEIIELPGPPLPMAEYSNLCFSMSHVSSKYYIVAPTSLHLAYYFWFGSKNWHGFQILVDDDYLNFDGFRCRPGFHDGCFCLLDKHGRLVVFKVEDENLGPWKILHTMKEHHVDLSSKRSFLVSCQGEFLLVTMERVRGFIEVFALNQGTTIFWEKVDNLRDYTLYLCKSSSFSTPARAKWMRNIIFLPRLHEGSIVYYSMVTKNYHCLANKEDTVEYHSTRELLFASWIEPSWAKTCANLFL